jgi:FMN-dependent NADH-azoreductase
MKILHLDSSILGENSVSRSISSAAVEAIRNTSPAAEVTYHDLVADPIAHLTGRYLAGTSPQVQHDQALQEDLTLGGRVLAEFLAADVVVVGVAFYNFTISSQLKAWVDRICVAGKTFRYTEKGPEGLAINKRVVLAIARGGTYGPGSGRETSEHAESYLRAIFAFLGVAHVETVVAEGIALGPKQREHALAGALKEAAALGRMGQSKPLR